MAKGPRYRVPLKRRAEGKTSYYQRRELLKSGMIRLVIRRSTKNMRVQFIDALPNGDIVKTSSDSMQLKNFGWNLTGGNIPAAYLTGYLAGKKAKGAGIENAILDLGLQTNSYGGRIYAALKGVVDAGIEVPVNDKIFPAEDVLKGEHITKIATAIETENKEAFQQKFARYHANKVKTDGLSKLVDKTVKSIDKEVK